MLNEIQKMAILAAHKASEVIMPYYRQSLAVTEKSDGSPLTMVDVAAHDVIIDTLKTTRIPVVSEESNDLMLSLEYYWLVDPLDGTKDFLAGNDEFTVNIALIEMQKPIFGVMLAPALHALYFGIPGVGAWYEKNGVRIRCQQAPKRDEYIMATSRFHDHPGVALFAKENNITHQVAVGSALKYGRLATGEIDVFPRFSGSSEWDIAAGQAILEGAGGHVLDWDTQLPLVYGKNKRRNPSLLSFRTPYKQEDFKLPFNNAVVM